MNRPLLVFAFFAAATAALVAQEASQSSPYSGVSNPPPDDTIQTDAPEAPAKPPASHPLTQPAPAPAQQVYAAPGSQTAPMPAADPAVTGTDEGIVQTAPQAPTSTMPVLANRAEPYDPDGDIVHPAPLGAGELAEGTMIRVRLLNGLSSTLTQQGETFRSRVASDVLQGGQVVIPAGAEISGRVVDVSKGSLGGHGSLMLKPETVTLPTGESFRLRAMVASAPGTHTQVNREGEIAPDSRLKRDGLEYGGAVGTGVVAGAYLGGPAGALAGGLVGAGLVTVHLLVSHPQAHLEEGDVLMLTLTERMRLAPAEAQGQ
ncbi:MAG: hypothetical protein P4L96_18575 [Rhodoferax sp.]|nr:hypothetical protein [Rhodoferax sp.]